MSIPRKERRPSRELLSELSVSQKQRLSTEKHHLKLRLDKLDVQRRRSLEVIDTERRMLCNSLQKQHHQQDQHRQHYRQRSSREDRRTGNESGPEASHPVHLRMSQTPDSISISRSISVDLGRNGRRLSVPLFRDQLPKSADASKLHNSEVQDLERAKGAVSPATVLSLVQRRNSDTTTLTSLNVSSRSSGKGFTFSQASESEKPTPKTVPDDNPSRRLSMPTLFPSLNTCSYKLQSSRSLDSDGGTPRPVARRPSLNTDRSRLLRRNSFKKTPDGAVGKMAGMHDVLQRSAIFQIQENEGSDEQELNGS